MIILLIHLVLSVCAWLWLARDARVGERRFRRQLRKWEGR